MRTYEGMFLVEPTIAAKEWPKVEEEIGRILSKNGATVVNVSKWGERKLAYPVKRSNRGTYVLTHFTANEQTVGKIRADLQLSEIVLRNVVTAHPGGELRTAPPKDFETAGLVPVRRGPDGGFQERSFRPFGGPPRT